MKRPILGSPAWLLSLAATARAQEAAPQADPQGGNLAAWLVLLIPASLAFLLVIFVLRRQKTSMAAVDRSLRMSEERIELARRQVALQEETNRLLKQLISARGHGDPG